VSTRASWVGDTGIEPV